MDQTLDLIKKHKSAVATLAERLLEKEVLKYKDVQEVLGPRPLPDYIYSEESDDETDTSSEEDWGREGLELERTVSLQKLKLLLVLLNSFVSLWFF